MALVYYSIIPPMIYRVLRVMQEVYWVAVKELNFSYYIGETISYDKY